MGVLKDMGWNGFSGSMWLAARRDCIPLTGTFELTPLCNFRCRMCYVRLDPERVAEHGRLHTADEWIDLARQAMAMGTYHITLTGGEVLTRPDFADIYRSLVEMGMLTSVLSNGSLIDADTIRLFQTYAPSRLRFTLYGASNETYKRLCRAPGGFDRVMRSLRALKEAEVPFSLAFTMTTENVDDTDAVLDIAESLGVGVGVTNSLSPAVRGAVSEAESLRVEGPNTPRITRPIDNDRPDQLAGAFEQVVSPDELFAHCKSYRTSFFVGWNGLMETCAYMTSCGTRPFDEGLAPAWKRLHEGLSRLRTPDACLACDLRAHCPICPGHREAETGRPDGIPRNQCELLRARLNHTRANTAEGGET